MDNPRLMKLSQTEQPQRYAGLFAVDFGDSTALGYTAQEVALLLESERYRDAKVYRVKRVSPDGQMELQAIANARFQLESGMFFLRSTLPEARADFECLRASAQADPPPTRAFVHLCERRVRGASPTYLTALIYPAECEDDLAAWLARLGYAGGDTVEGGISHVTNYYEDEKTILDRAQLWSQPAVPSRSLEQLHATASVALQR